jgi:hypothetical protein
MPFVISKQVEKLMDGYEALKKREVEPPSANYRKRMRQIRLMHRALFFQPRRSTADVSPFPFADVIPKYRNKWLRQRCLVKFRHRHRVVKIVSRWKLQLMGRFSNRGMS